jgi:cytoskeleton protein RodZ
VSIGNSPDDNSPQDEPPIEIEKGDRPSIGRALQQARIAAGLTVDDVSNATRVRIAIVHAIEQDDFTPCGGDVYARGHLKTLARAVHLDPAPLLAQYDASTAGGPRRPPRHRCSRPSGSVRSAGVRTGPPPWSPRSSR